MLDPQLLRERTDHVAHELAKRGFQLDVAHFKKLESQRKHLQIQTQHLQNERNQRSKDIGLAKANGEDITAMRAQVNQISTQLEENKQLLENVLNQIDAIAISLPNLMHESVPLGNDSDANVEIRRWGEIPSFDFPIQSHDDLGEALGGLDFELAAKIAGSRFVVMKKHIAQLHRALIQFMLDVHTQEHGYEEIYVPYIVSEQSLFATGQLPKFEQDLFKITSDHAFYLISTSEIPVTNTMRDRIVAERDLPYRYVCHSPCFRSEAGSYGKDTKGMIRQHQFEKVELVWITHPKQSYEALECLTQHAEVILQRLELPYRVMVLCAGDMGSNAAKTYDLEVWLPSQHAYREISSCSNMTSFQARRLKARFRDENDPKKIDLVHTLNGSGLAVGRTLVAILENYQTQEGYIQIPKVLQPYMHGLKIIKPS